MTPKRRRIKRQLASSGNVGEPRSPRSAWRGAGVEKTREKESERDRGRKRVTHTRTTWIFKSRKPKISAKLCGFKKKISAVLTRTIGVKWELCLLKTGDLVPRHFPPFPSFLPLLPLLLPSTNPAEDERKHIFQLIKLRLEDRKRTQKCWHIILWTYTRNLLVGN